MRCDQLIFTIGFWIFIVIPAPLVFMGLSGDTSLEARRLAAYPEIRLDNVLEGETYEALSAALEDRMPMRTSLVGFRSRLARRGLIPNPFEKVVFGYDDWLYVAESFDPHCPEPERRRVVDRLTELADLLHEYDIDLRVIMIPNKASIHEESLPEWIRPEHDAARLVSRELAEGLAARGSWYLDLETPLRHRLQAAASPPLYHPTDTHWTWRGGEVFVNVLVNSFEPDLYDPQEIAPVTEVPVTFDLDRLSGQSVERMLSYYAASRPGTDAISSTGTGGAVTTIKTGEPGRPISGRTVLVRDSFWDFVSPVAQDYFEQLVSLHVNAAAQQSDLAEQIAKADRVVLALGERKFCEAALKTIIADGFSQRLATVLRNQRPSPPIN